MQKIIIPALLLFIFCQPIKAQENADNISIFFALADSSIAEMYGQLDTVKDTFIVAADLAGDYGLFRNRFLYQAERLGIPVSFGSAENAHFRFAVHNAQVIYSETYKESFFGDWYVTREIELTGSYSVAGEKLRFQEFSYRSRDSVLYENIIELESSGIPFTKGELPPEPVFSGLLEPIVLIASSAAAIILFFTIRSQ